MAKIKTEDGEMEVSDGSAVKEACKDLGIVFGCEQGRCGTCAVRVEEGEENLEDKNENEQFMALAGNYRLMCQSKIKSGEIKIKQNSR
jgi:ferredoxin